MAKLSRCRGAPSRPSLVKRRHVKREAGREKENEGWRLVVSLFAAPVSPMPKPVIASVSEAIQFQSAVFWIASSFHSAQ
jgi:hypothetical protein